MLNPLLYDENNHHNPTELLSEIYKDLKDLSINAMYKKYNNIITPHELAGILLQEVSVECSKKVLYSRINKE